MAGMRCRDSVGATVVGWCHGRDGILTDDNE
jgi:hypothetical protein